jgi:hypothetical protein
MIKRREFIAGLRRGGRLVPREHLGLAGGLLVVAKVEPSRGFTAGILHPEGFRVLDDGPWRWEAAGGHVPSRAKCSRARTIAGLSGFLIFSQCPDRPD